MEAICVWNIYRGIICMEILPCLGLCRKNPNQSVFFSRLFEVCFEVGLFLVGLIQFCSFVLKWLVLVKIFPVEIAKTGPFSVST